MNGETDKWKLEAQKQAAGAGELRIKIAEHLEELRMRITDLKEMEHPENDDMSAMIIKWEISQLKKEEEWLEDLLHTDRENTWKSHIERRFEKVV